MKVGKKNMTDSFFMVITFCSSIVILLIVIGIFVSLYIESSEAIDKFGFFKFIFDKRWDYTENIYGALRPLAGSLLTSFLALLVAIPVALGTATFITEICPNFLRGIISQTIELLAAIPSIIYGMWGLFAFAPLMEKSIQKWVSSSVGQIPIIGSFFAVKYAGGVSIFTAGLVLSIMIIPFIASITRDTFNQTPALLKESAYAIGCTRWEVIRFIVIPYCKTGIQSGIIIAAGRALGETMAIAYVIGNGRGELSSVFDPYTTITSVLANEFNEAAGVHRSSLFLIALILFMVNFVTLAAAKIYVRNKAIK